MSHRRRGQRGHSVDPLIMSGRLKDFEFSSEQAGESHQMVLPQSFPISCTYLDFFPCVFGAYRSGLDDSDPNDIHVCAGGHLTLGPCTKFPAPGSNIIRDAALG